MNKRKEAITYVALLAFFAVIFRKTIVFDVLGPNNAGVILIWGLGIFAVLFAILSIVTIFMAKAQKETGLSLRERLRRTSWMRLIPFLLALVSFVFLQELMYSY